MLGTSLMPETCQNGHELEEVVICGWHCILKQYRKLEARWQPPTHFIYVATPIYIYKRDHFLSFSEFSACAFLVKET